MPFSQRSLDFLAENHIRNSKEWFAGHKSDYHDFVLKPMQDLVESLSSHMLKIDPQFITEPKIDKTISRIYRDTRFSKDESIYRNNCWLTFMREKKLYMGLPAFWFEINPAGFGYGMGYYMASPQSMDSIRKMILTGDSSFREAWSGFNKQTTFAIEGELYKKSKYPDQPEDLKCLLDRKSLSFNRYGSDMRLLFSDELSDRLKNDFNLLAPMYDFLCSAESKK